MQTSTEETRLPVDIDAQPPVQAAAALRPVLRRYQEEIDAKRRIIVGVNEFVEKDEKLEIPILRIDPRYEREQIERLGKVRAGRDDLRWKSAMDVLRAAIRSEENLMEPVLDAVRAYATVGEIVDLMRQEYGTWREPEIF